VSVFRAHVSAVAAARTTRKPPTCTATFAASHIPGSALLSYERGGHFVLLTEQEEVSRAVLTHVRDHAR